MEALNVFSISLLKLAFSEEEGSGDLHLGESGECCELVAADYLPRVFVFTPLNPSIAVSNGCSGFASHVPYCQFPLNIPSEWISIDRSGNYQSVCV